MVDYPRKVVWYIESRPWSGTDEAPSFAPGNPHLMGSAVAVELESFADAGGPGQLAKIKKYLLTCTHVVRQSARNLDYGWGPLLEEIFCWEWGRG